MLIQVKHNQQQKYVKLDDVGGRFDFLQFHEKVIERFCLPPDAELIYKDATGTEVDVEIFSELVAQGNVALTVFSSHEFSDSSLSCASEMSDSSFSSSASTIILDEVLSKRQHSEDPHDAASAKQLIEAVLRGKSGGEAVLQEYQTTETLTDATRRQMVNILVAHMTDNHGHLPTKAVKEEYALGIVTLFPSLKDPYTKKGYEHFYDAASSTGYISWCLKKVQRKIHRGSAVTQNSSVDISPGGPHFQRTVNVERQLDGDACQEAISLLNHTTDNSLILQKMRETFQHRQKLVNDPGRSADILSIFPRFLDTIGLVEQDFTLLFDDETSSKLLQKWDVIFKPNIIQEAKRLTSTPELRCLVRSSEITPGSDFDEATTYDQEMASLLLLVHLLPPPPGGPKSPKISACDAAERLVIFHKSCCSLDEHLRNQQGRQPYLLAVGRQKSKIDSFYIAMDKHLIPCQANRSLLAIAYHWETFTITQNEYGPVKSFSLRDENVVNNEVLEMILSKDVFSTSWVKVDGVEYKAGLVVCSAMEGDMPVFCQISNILLVEDHIFFLTDKLFTEKFHDHHHAFRILRSEERFILKMSELKIHKTFDIQSSYNVSDNSLYIIPAFTMF